MVRRMMVENNGESTPRVPEPSAASGSAPKAEALHPQDVGVASGPTSFTCGRINNFLACPLETASCQTASLATHWHYPFRCPLQQ